MVRARRRREEQGDLHGRVDHESLGRSLHQVGYCLSSRGQFEAAQPWFERAAAAREQGDLHGRVDHDEPRPQPAPGGLLPVELGPVRGGAALVRARRRSERAGRPPWPRRSRQSRHQPEPGGRLPVEPGPVRGGAALVRARRRCSRAGRPPRPRRSRGPRPQPEPGGSLPVETEVSSRRRCLGSSAPSPQQSTATCTAGSIRRASAPA